MAESFSPFEVRRYYEIRVPALSLTDSREWRGPCPIHKGTHQNFAVEADSGLWICFSKCGRGGDIIALEQELSGTDFLTARKNVYSLLGRGLPARTHGFRNAEERRRFARRRASAKSIAESARRWHHAKIAALETQKATEPVLCASWIAACQAVATFERMSAREILEAYMRSVREEAHETTRLIKWAEEEERECAQLAAIMVRLIAQAERMRNAV